MAHWETIMALFSKLEERLMGEIILESRRGVMTHCQAVTIMAVEGTGGPWGKNQPQYLGTGYLPAHPPHRDTPQLHWVSKP